MKNIVASLVLAVCLLLTGCEAFTKAFSTNTTNTTSWDGSFKRTIGVGTGIDPQAREIENRLGYKPERF